MSKFKVGDRIVVSERYPVKSFWGVEGTISISPEFRNHWKVAELSFIPDGWKHSFFLAADENLEQFDSHILTTSPLWDALK